MRSLHITLFGQPSIALYGEPISADFHKSKKACALLYYLAMTGEQQARPAVATLLWGDQPLKKALANLRGRSGLIPLRPFSTFLHSDNSSLALLPQPGFSLDVAQFEQALVDPQPSVENLTRAAELYQGDFWLSFDGDVSAEFESWVVTTREQLRRKAIGVFYQLAHYHTQWQEYDQALHYVGRLLEIEPWLEDAHRQMMTLLAYQGQTGRALAQYETCRNILRNQLNIEPAASTTGIYNQIRDEQLALPAPIPFLAPTQPAHFTGRESLLRDITAALSPSSTLPISPPILALVGMGGIGKTTLVTTLAHQLRRSFPDGVLWADALHSRPEDVIDSWAQLYGYDFSSLNSLAARQTAWRGVTEKKSLLIVIDDVWEAAQIRPLLPTSASSAVVMTTRNRDLASLLNATIVDVPILQDSASVALLTRVIGLERVEAERDSAEKIATLLENLPLAIEILAQRLRSRPRMTLTDVVGYLTEINSRLDMLHMEDRAVRSTLELSWQTLDAELRDAFAFLGIFEGRTVEPDAYAAVSGWSAWDAGDRLEDLVALSLLKHDDAHQASTRYRQHALLADFALEKSEARADVVTLRSRFVDHFYRFATEHNQAFDRLRPNWHNFQQAIAIAHEQNNWQTAYAITETLRTPLLIEGRYNDLNASHKLAHEAALALEDTEKVAEGLFHRGLTAIEQSRYPEAEKHLTQCLSLFENDLEGVDGVIRTKLQLGRICLEQNRVDEATAYLQSSHALAMQSKDTNSIAEASFRLARIAYRAGEYEATEQLAGESLRLHRANGNLSSTTHVLALSGRSLMDRAQRLDVDDGQRGAFIADATAYLNEAYQIAEAADAKSDRSVLLLDFGWLYQLTEQYEKSAESLTHARRMYAKMGDVKSEARAIYRMSRLHESTGQFELALTEAYESLALFNIMNDTFNQVDLQGHIGDLLLALNSPEDARLMWQKALHLASSANLERFIPSLEKRLHS